jgi:sterol desaturase/sphingolipid hydroxylase (fatty acid hydroxylase superfamily)
MTVHFAILVGAMVVLAVIESAAPFRARGGGRARLRLNVALTALALAFNALLVVGGALVSNALGARGFGLLAAPRLGPIALLVVGVIALDFATWVAHFIMHHVPALWRVHRLHHADAHVDVTTALRQHPLETVVRAVFVFVPAWMLGVPVAAITMYRLLSALNALAEHANVRLWRPLDAALALAWVTPDMHKVHHSRAQPETDSNYGNLLSLFDRAFRTFTPTARAAGVTYGLDERSPP